MSRGQALVETALLLPLLALLLVMALDFGRVFLGWVALQNAARIGADYAASTPTAWDGMPAIKQVERDLYADLIEADTRAINCALAGGAPPDPTFEDGLDTGPEDTGDYDDGDYAIVELECSFSLITPLAEGVFGGPITMVAHEEFPVHRVLTLGLPDPPVLPTPTPTPSPSPTGSPGCGTPVADFTWSPTPGIKGQPMSFTDASNIGTCTATAWSWAWDDGSGNSSQQNSTHTYTWNGNSTKRYNVTLTITTTGGVDSETKQVTVTP